MAGFFFSFLLKGPLAVTKNNADDNKCLLLKKSQPLKTLMLRGVEGNCSQVIVLCGFIPFYIQTLKYD